MKEHTVRDVMSRLQFFKSSFNCDKNTPNLKLGTWAISKCAGQYVHIIVPLSPPAAIQLQSSFILQNWNSRPIEHHLPAPAHPPTPLPPPARTSKFQFLLTVKEK